MSNSTGGWENVPNYVVYICQGVTIGGSNLFIVMVIFRYSALRSRKEYLVIAGQAFADGLNQVAYLAAGIYRIRVITCGNWTTKITPAQCMHIPHSILWLWVYTAATLMLAMTSLDRLLSVSFPLQYIGWPTTYSWGLLVGAYGYAIGLGMLTYILTIMDGSQERVSHAAGFTSTCWGDAGQKMLQSFVRHQDSRVWPGIAIFLYVLVWIQYKRSQSKVSSMTTEAEKVRELKIQRRVTISIGVSCLCTMFLWIIPNEVGYLFYDTSPKLATIAFAVSNLNPLCNVIIYPLYHQCIRQGMKAFFRCKVMPDDIRMWKSINEAKSAQEKQKSNKQRSRTGNQNVHVQEL